MIVSARMHPAHHHSKEAKFNPGLASENMCTYSSGHLRQKEKKKKKKKNYFEVRSKFNPGPGGTPRGSASQMHHDFKN